MDNFHNVNEPIKTYFVELDIGDLFVYNGFIFCKATGGFALNMQTNKRFKFTRDTLVEIA